MKIPARNITPIEDMAFSIGGESTLQEFYMEVLATCPDKTGHYISKSNSVVSVNKSIKPNVCKITGTLCMKEICPTVIKEEQRRLRELYDTKD